MVSNKPLRANLKIRLHRKHSLHSLKHRRIRYPSPINRMDRPIREEAETEKEEGGGKEIMDLVKMEHLRAKIHDQRREPVG